MERLESSTQETAVHRINDTETIPGRYGLKYAQPNREVAPVIACFKTA